MEFSNDKTQKQSLINSLRRGYFAHVRFMLENGQADPNECNKHVNNENHSFNAPLPSISSSAKSQKNAASVPKSGRTPIMFCSLIEDDLWSYSIAQNLIEKGASLRLRDSHGMNALQYACIFQRKKLVDLFLNAIGDFNLLSTDNMGNTAMHIASLGQAQDICLALNQTCVKYNIDPFKDIPRNKYGFIPYNMCSINGHSNCVDYLNSIKQRNDSKSSLTQSVLINPNALDTVLDKLTPYPLLAASPAAEANILENMRNFYNFKEPPIKKNSVDFNGVYLTNDSPRTPVKKPSTPSGSSNDKKFRLQRSANPVIALVTKIDKPSQSEEKINVRTYSANVKISPRLMRDRQGSISWRNQITDAFDEVECRKTKSYRKAYAYAPTTAEQWNYLAEKNQQNAANLRKGMSSIRKASVLSSQIMNLKQMRRLSILSSTSTKEVN